MKIILTLSSDRSICDSVKATLPDTDMLLFEYTLEDTLRRLVSITPDVIILDDSPTFGLRALHELHSTLPNTPVLVLTTNAGNDALSSYLMAGALSCIPKPFDCTSLLEQADAIEPAAAPMRTHNPPMSQHPVTNTSITQHQQALRWMSRNTSKADDPDRLLQSLLDAITDILDPARAGVFLHKNGAIRITHSQGIPESVVDTAQLNFTHGLMRHLETNTSLVEKHQPGLHEDIYKELAALGVQMAIPISTQGHTCGVLVLGEKYSGHDYSQNERDLLTTMIRYTSSCLERSRKHQSLSLQQQHLNTVLTNISAGVVTVGQDGTITMMNKSAERILHIRADDVLGYSLLKLGSAFADIVLRSMKENVPRIRQEIRDVSINATLGLSVTPLGSDGAVAIFSPIPTGNSAQNEDDAISYSPLWEYLATRVAQEIKNPMVPINTYAQLLPTKFDSQDFREEFSGVVQESVGRINKVVESIYEFARHPRLNLKNNNLNESVRQLLESYEEQFSEQDIQLETNLDTDDISVSLDPQLFTRAVSNVIQNSIEAMPEGGTLFIGTEQHDDTCTLSMSDTGTGISEQDAELIFMPFFSTKENGMGLGLTMAERIIKEHDGRLELDPQHSGGGAFLLHLPSTTSQN